jgi:hypothetical protein
MRKIQIKGIDLTFESGNCITDTDFKDAFTKMHETYSLTVPEFRKLLNNSGIRFNYINDLDMFPPLARGDVVKFTKSSRGDYAGYDRNGKIVLGNVTAPGFYHVTSVLRREPTFTKVQVRKTLYDLYPEMSYITAKKVFDVYGISHGLFDNLLFAWKHGFSFLCYGTLDTVNDSFTEFCAVVPHNIEGMLLGYDGRDVDDHYYNLKWSVNYAFLQGLIKSTEAYKDKRLACNIPSLLAINTKEIPEGLREVVKDTITWKTLNKEVQE